MSDKILAIYVNKESAEQPQVRLKFGESGRIEGVSLEGLRFRVDNDSGISSIKEVLNSIAQMIIEYKDNLPKDRYVYPTLKLIAHSGK